MDLDCSGELVLQLLLNADAGGAEVFDVSDDVLEAC